jgi:hypothetical protein
MSWKEWVLYLCHIETLFIIGVTILVIYLRFFRRGNKSTFVQLEELAGKIVDKSGTIFQSDISIDESHSSLIKKPEKKVHKHEERCREIFQEIFGVEFKTIRPDWLKNPATGKPLELDGYNPNIMTPMGRGIAFEYDGIQHAKYTPTFQPKGPVEFFYQVKKDSWKDAVCKQRRLMLIRIPNFVSYNDLERFIKGALRKRGMGHYVR